MPKIITALWFLALTLSTLVAACDADGSPGSCFKPPPCSNCVPVLFLTQCGWSCPGGCPKGTSTAQPITGAGGGGAAPTGVAGGGGQ